jgi:hypothetical protein
VDLVSDSTGIFYSGAFDRHPDCPFFCEGHADPTVTEHGTPLDYFGTDGPVTVNQAAGKLPMVALVDLPTPYCRMAAPRARMLALQLLQAADLVDRASLPGSATEAVRLPIDTLVGAGA